MRKQSNTLNFEGQNIYVGTVLNFYKKFFLA